MSFHAGNKDGKHYCSISRGRVLVCDRGRITRARDWKVYDDVYFEGKIMSTKVTRIWKLDSPMHCRDFLSNLYLNEKKIEQVTTESGQELKFTDMNDAQIVFYASEIAKMIEAQK